MERIEFLKEQIERIFIKPERILFSEGDIHWLIYDELFLCLNSVEVINQVRNVPIVYCIWISDGSRPKSVYVGHSSASLAKQRLNNHFVKKHKKTGAQLEKVGKAISEGKLLSVTFLKIDPD